MNWDQVKGNWKQFKGDIKVRWGKLTDDDLDVIAGRRDHLIGSLQKRYGIAKEQAEDQLDKYLQSQKEAKQAKEAETVSTPAK